MLVRLTACILVLGIFADGFAFAKKKKKKEEEVTQVLELPKDPPQAVIAQAERLVYFNSPLSAKGLLSQQIRDAIKGLWNASRGAQIVKIRAFVAGSGDMRRVPMIVSELFTEKKMALPAVSVIQVGSLPLEGSQVILEATAQDKKPVNPNGVSFLSGLKTAPSNAIAATCFVASFDKLPDLRSQFSSVKTVNFVQLRRDTLGDFYECEVVAAPSSGQDAVTGKLVLTGTQLAFGSGEQDLRLAFGRLEKAISPLNAKLTDSVWAQFYPLSSKASQEVAKIQRDYFGSGKRLVGTPLVFEGLPSMDAQFGVEVITTAK